MARTDTLNNFLTDVATAIRNKEGTTDEITANEFDTRIENLSTGGGGNNLPIPTMLNEVDVNYVTSLIQVENSLLQAISNENPYTEEAVTLYTPSAEHKYYFIRNNGSGYQLIWSVTPYLKPYSGSTLMMCELYIPGGYFKNGVIRKNTSVGVSMESISPYRSSNTYSTLEECIASAKDKNTSYTLGNPNSSWTSYTVSETSITPCSNMVCFNANNVIVPNRKISSNETIEVIS